MTPSRKDRIRSAFDAAASRYDRTADVQRRAGQRLARVAAGAELPSSPRILEVGCGTGLMTRILFDALPGATWTVTDLSPAMVAACRNGLPDAATFLVMDGEAPTVAGPFDLVCSNMAAQWFDDPASGLAGLVPLIAPGGLLAVNVLTDGTFAEWIELHAAEGVVPAAPEFVTAERLAETVAPFGAVDVDTRTETVRYPTAGDFLRRVKAIGAGTGNRPPLGPAVTRRLMARLDATGDDTGVAISYVVTQILLRKKAV